MRTFLIESIDPFDDANQEAEMRKFFQGLMQEEEGAAMVEYALMVALIAAVLVVAVPLLTTAVKTSFTTVASDLTGS